MTSYFQDGGHDVHLPLIATYAADPPASRLPAEQVSTAITHYLLVASITRRYSFTDPGGTEG